MLGCILHVDDLKASGLSFHSRVVVSSMYVASCRCPVSPTGYQKSNVVCVCGFGHDVALRLIPGVYRALV